MQHERESMADMENGCEIMTTSHLLINCFSSVLDKSLNALSIDIMLERNPKGCEKVGMF